jgi:hypothetical protein
VWLVSRKKPQDDIGLGYGLSIQERHEGVSGLKYNIGKSQGNHCLVHKRIGLVQGIRHPKGFMHHHICQVETNHPAIPQIRRDIPFARA